MTSRLANICSRVSVLQLSSMDNLTEVGRLSITNMFRLIIQNNPPIEFLNMYEFSKDKDRDENIGELVLESLLSSSIDTIIDINLSSNRSWFKHLGT